jgi:DNA helicase-2/ATP-dependent DNA helicase PcrA
MDYDTAIEFVLERADQFLSGELGEVDRAALDIPTDPFAAIPKPTLQRRHSYTSLGTIEDCSRRHYLDHVVYAPELPSRLRPSLDQGKDTKINQGEPTVKSEPTGASNREIGILFHQTAEAAIDRNQLEKSDWQELCQSIATQRGLEEALDEALNCIDRFFQTPVSEWELLSAEHSFGIEIDDFHVVGEIDCLARQPNGELAVLDYKATDDTKDEADRQLPLYILACRELFDEPVTTAGYVYVGGVGPDVDLRTYDEERLVDARARIHAGLQAANVSFYEDYTAGDHCKWCPHNDLPCSDF